MPWSLGTGRSKSHGLLRKLKNLSGEVIVNPQNDRPKIYEDEINLYNLWKRIIKRKKLILWIFIISVISAGIISFIMPNIYRVEVGVRIQPKDSSATKELISTKELFEIIGTFDREKIKAIFSQNFHSIKEVKITQIPASNDKFKVTVELTQAAYFQDAIKVFMQYLNNIPLIKRVVEESREQLTKRLEEIDVVMAKSQEDADRFQAMMVKEKLNPIGFNPVQFNRMRSELEVEKIALKQTIKSLTGFEIITQPTISSKPVRPKPVLYIILAGLISLVAGFFIATFLDYLERIKK
jgi:LPS O-antigen subunit length determinant protein (WzzB/FepE family)